jgi:hypothetical protein
MVATLGVAFMQVRRGPTIVRLFIIAALLWLAILLGLGSLDPMTRTQYQVQAADQDEGNRSSPGNGSAELLWPLPTGHSGWR